MAVTYIIKGKWLLKMYPDTTTSISQSVSFTSNGSSYKHIRTNADCIQFTSKSGFDTYVYMYGSNTQIRYWYSEQYRYLDFGDEGQSVDESFYLWLIGNVAKTVSGTWKFKENVTFTTYNIAQDVNFSFGSITNSFINLVQIIVSRTNGTITLRQSKDYGGQNVYYNKSWSISDHSFREIDFGSDIQEVSENFYTWLTTNAVTKDCTAIVYYDRFSAPTKDAHNAVRLKCCGKKAKSDIEVYFGHNGCMLYSDGIEKEMPLNSAIKLTCEGKKMLSNVVIATYPKLKGVRLQTLDGFIITDVNGIPITVITL